MESNDCLRPDQSILYEQYEAALMRIALAELMEEEVRALEAEPLSYHPDAQAEARTLQRIEKAARTRRRRRPSGGVLRRVGTMAACCALLLFVGLSTAVATSQTVRHQLMRLLVSIEDEYTNLSLVPLEDGDYEVPAGWTGLYYPSYIPKGYVADYVEENYAAYHYWRDEAKQLSFSEEGESAQTSIDSEGADIRSVSIHGAPALLSLKPDFSFLTWSEGSRYFIVSLAGDDAELLTRVAQSVRRIDK